jgi:hypothetical protein
LAGLGFAWDSSHNGADHPWPSALPLDPALIDPARCEGVTEIPVSQIRRADGGLRPFQLCALSRQEMKAALGHAARHGHPTTTIVSHSFELATRDGKRVNKLVRGRFDWLCRFLAKHEATMPTLRFDALAASPPAEPADPLPPDRLRTARRMAEQAVGTALYEKPLVGAALVALPPIAALEGLIVYAGL